MQLTLLDIATLDFSLHKISKENVCTIRLRNFFTMEIKKKDLLCAYSGCKRYLCYFLPTFHFRRTNFLTKKKKKKENAMINTMIKENVLGGRTLYT